MLSKVYFMSALRLFALTDIRWIFFLRDVYFDFKYSHMYSHIQIGRGNVI